MRSIATLVYRSSHRGALLIGVARAGEWWEYKLVPIFAVFYATALAVGIPIASLWPAALALLAALVPGAIYVSVINDLTDREEDAVAGKPNRMAALSPAARTVLIAAPIAAGVAMAFFWRRDHPLLIAYLSAWLSFSLYSLPPVRLKSRGFLGALADAAGAHLFPAMVATILVYRAAGVELSGLWLASLGLWSMSYGLRGIFWHQMLDAENDNAAGVRTFVQRCPREKVRWLGNYVLFPLEVAALTALLLQLPSWLPILFLIPYAMLVKRRVRVFRMRAVIFEPRPRYLIILQEYYDLFLPFALLLASVGRFPFDMAALAVHFSLFPRRLVNSLRDLWKLRSF